MRHLFVGRVIARGAEEFSAVAAGVGPRQPGVDGLAGRAGPDRPAPAHQLLEGERSRPDVGAGENRLAEVLTSHPEHPELSVIWSGLTPPNPAALLSSHRFETLLVSLRLDFDRVIIDTSPISVGADASVIAGNVDGTLFVVDERSTKRSEAQSGLNQLRSVRARVLGVVLNRSSVPGPDGYYYKGDENGARPRRVTLRSKNRDRTETFS